MNARAARGAILLALFLVPASSGAQAHNPEREREARAHFEAGSDAFGHGDYETAASEFRRAYDLAGYPQLLYNIGASYDRLHRWESARDAFRRYLQALPNATDRAEVEARLHVIESEVERARAPRAPEQPRVVVVERPVIVQHVVTDEPRPWRAAFWVATGLAVVAGGTTLAVGLIANARYDSLRMNCGMRPQGCDPDDIDDMRLRQTLINAGIVTTSVFAAGAVLSFVLDASRHRESPPATRATLGPLPGGGGMLVLEGAL